MKVETIIAGLIGCALAGWLVGGWYRVAYLLSRYWTIRWKMRIAVAKDDFREYERIRGRKPPLI